MNVQLIALAALLAMLAGCPDTPPATSADVAQAGEEIAINEPNDAESEAIARTLGADLEIATPAGNQAEAATVRDASLESAERFDH